MSKVNTASTKHNLIYWSIVIALFLFSLIAGSLGFKQYLILHCESYSGLRHIYRTIQLFTSEGGDLTMPIPLVLHVVRFTALLTTFMAVFLTLSEIFRDQLKRLRISWMRNHVVIIGLGTKGKNVLNENLEDGERVLVLEKDPLNPHLASVRPRKPYLIIGDSTNINTLKRARIPHAKKVYLLMGDDSQQITACLLIYDLLRNSSVDLNIPDEKSPDDQSGLEDKSTNTQNYILNCGEDSNNTNDSLECIMHLKNLESLQILRNNELIKNEGDELCLSVFSVYENAARELYQKYPPDRNGLSVKSKEFVQLIIFGFGQAGEALALQAALNGHYLNWKSKSPRVVIFDRMATELVEDFKQRYPTYESYCELIPKSMEADSPRLITELVSYLRTPAALNTVVLCFDNRTKNMLLGLQISNIDLPDLSAPIQIFSRTDDDEAFAGVINNIIPYSQPSRVCSKNAIQGEQLDEMAKAYHKNYLAMRELEDDFGAWDADVCWEDLSQEFKDSNRKAADHIGVKVRGINCTITELDAKEEEADMSKAERLLLYELEHRRWNAERSLAGWTFAPEKNNKIRQTPYLVDWNELPPGIQKYDIDAVDSIPDILKIAKQKIVRNIDK